jgi:hypothetical protein
VLLSAPNNLATVFSLLSTLHSVFAPPFKKTQSGGGDGEGDERDEEGGGGVLPRITPFLARHSFAGPDQIHLLLQALSLDCDEQDKCLLQYAFMCPVCDTLLAPCTTLSDQIRAVTGVC